MYMEVEFATRRRGNESQLLELLCSAFRYVFDIFVIRYGIVADNLQEGELSPLEFLARLTLPLLALCLASSDSSINMFACSPMVSRKHLTGCTELWAQDLRAVCHYIGTIV